MPRRRERAQFGAFFYNVDDGQGGSYMLYTISGVDPSHFSKFAMPRNTAVFAPTFAGEGTVRSANIRMDPRFGHNAPYQGTPPGHLPVVSYLAVSVKGKEGRIIGGLFFGHSAEGVFSERDERFAEAIASQASVALENARLYRAAQEELEQRRKVEAELEQQRSFLAIAQKSGHIGSWQLDLKANPTRVTWSEELELLYGFVPGTFTGRYEDWVGALHPDDRELASRSLLRAIEKTRTVDHRVPHCQERRRGTEHVRAGPMSLRRQRQSSADDRCEYRHYRTKTGRGCATQLREAGCHGQAGSDNCTRDQQPSGSGYKFHFPGAAQSRDAGKREPATWNLLIASWSA